MSRLKLAFLGLLALLAVSAVTSSSALAVEGGPYVYLQGGASPLMNSLQLEASQSGSATLTGTLAGAAIEISCEEGHAESTSVENILPVHLLGLSIFHFLKCKVLKPANKECLVLNELVLVHSHILGLYVGGIPRVQFAPEGPDFTLINIDSCSNSALNGAFPVTGFAVALVNNTSQLLEFHKESGSGLEFAGNPAKFTANFTVAMLGGGALEIK